MPHEFKNLGYKPPEKVDPRNYVLEKAQPVVPFPPSYKTDVSALGVYMQDQIPDCVENAVTKAKQYHIYKLQNAIVDLSRRFLAYFTVQDDGFPISNGTNLLNALKEAKNRGISEASYFPDDHTLDETTFSTTPPPQAAIDNAATHKISTYAFVQDLSADGLKNAIYQNGLVIVGLKLDKAWWTDTEGNVTWDAAKILPLRPPSDPASESGHAVILYAYDEQYFYLWNSFGPTWGDQGHGWFGPEYLPHIYEAATIVDFTPEQLQKAQQVATAIQDLQNAENATQDPAQKTIIQKVIGALAWYFTEIFR